MVDTKPKQYKQTHICTETYKAVKVSGLSVFQGEYVMVSYLIFIWSVNTFVLYYSTVLKWLKDVNSEEMLVQNQSGESGIISKYVIELM